MVTVTSSREQKAVWTRSPTWQGPDSSCRWSRQQSGEASRDAERQPTERRAVIRHVTTLGHVRDVDTP
eukprot:3240531-Rhodomonas_salina.2